MPYDKQEYGRAWIAVAYQNNRYARRGFPPSQNTLTTRQWLDLQIRDGFRCRYCQKYCEPPVDYLQIDHVIPLSRGGANTIENIVPACRACNRSKGTGDAPVVPNFQTDRI